MAWVTKQTAAKHRTGHYYMGKEIALHKRQGFSGKRKNHNLMWFPEAIKLEAAALYAVVKEWKTVAELTSVPLHELKKWALEPWWNNVVQNVRKEQNEVLDRKMTEVLDSAIDLIKDRIIGGEYLLDRQKTRETGEPVYHRIPLRAKDATIAVDTLFDKRQLLRGEATTRTETVSETDKLKKLQENFERLARSKGINSEGNVIDQEDIERLPSEIGIGEEPIEADFIEEGGDEALAAGGIFQGQK